MPHFRTTLCTLTVSHLHCTAGSSRSFTALRKDGGLCCGSRLREGRSVCLCWAPSKPKGPKGYLKQVPGLSKLQGPDGPFVHSISMPRSFSCPLLMGIQGRWRLQSQIAWGRRAEGDRPVSPKGRCPRHLKRPPPRCRRYIGPPWDG